MLASNSTLTQVTGNPYFEWTGNDLTYTPEDYEDIEAGEKTAATQACAYGLFWQKSMVRRALGETKMFENTGDPTYYGDVYSFLNRMGGRRSRGDAKGVLGLIQEYHAS